MKLKIRILFIIIFIFSLYNHNIIIADVDMEEGIYARYTFEDYDYTTVAYDAQNNANYLIEYGNPTHHYSDVLGIGIYYHFDGDDYLKDNGANGLIADGISLNVPRLTICTVIKSDYDTEQATSFTVSETGRDGFFLRQVANDNLTWVRLRDSTGAFQDRSSSPYEINTTGWTLLTWSYKSGDNGFNRMWHNTTLVFNETGSILIPQIENRFEMMRCQYFGYYAEGDVGFLEIYTQPVNDDWVIEKYNSVFGIDVNVTSAWVDMSDMLFEELLFGTGFWFGLLLIIAILQIVSYMVPTFSALGGVFSILLFVSYILNMNLNGFHTFGIILMAINGVYLLLQSSD